MISRDRHWLLESIAQSGDREAIVYGEDSLSYARLHARIKEWFSILDENGVLPGSVIGIRSDRSADACALFLALVFNGSIAVPLSRGKDDPRWYVQAARADRVAEIGDTGAWSWLQLRPDEPPPLLRALQQRGGGGLVVFSSGTTGLCKAGLFDFETLIKRYREARCGYRTLLFLQLDHLGGINTMLHTLANSGTLIVTEDRRPDPVCLAIEHHRVELLPTTPTFLRMLAISGAHLRYDLTSLRLITYGTEPMPASTLQALTAAFPNVRFKQTYGLSELGVLPTRSPASDSLWLQIGGLGCETRIVDNILWIRSETAMLGYLNAPTPFDKDGWYNTEDAVEVNGEYLRILGRTSDLINVGGQKVYPAEIENVLLDLDNICEATVWGRANAVTGQVVAARLTLARPEDQEAFERRLHRFCRGRLEAYKIPLHIEIVGGDHHGGRFKKMRPNKPSGCLTAGARDREQQRCTALS
jgi:acyl-CoA synthetase (AMP-forming)/AMP-acid ligase II